MNLREILTDDSKTDELEGFSRDNVIVRVV